VITPLLVVLATVPVPSGVPYPPLDGLEPVVARQLEALRADVERARSEGRADAAAYGQAGAVYHAYEMAAPAEACYARAQEQAPHDFRWPYLLGILRETDNRLAEAAGSLERALAVPDRYYPAVVRLARIYLALGQVEKAAAVLEPARRHSPRDPAMLAVLGDLRLAQRRPAEAVEALELALREQPAATRLHYPLAQAYRRLGEDGKAREHLGRSGGVGVRPRDPVLEMVLAQRRGARVHVAEGRRALAAGDVPGAAAAFRRALAEDPADLPALVNLAAAEAQGGRTSAALGYLEQAVRLDPRDATARYNLGVLLAGAGRPAEAEPHLRAALAAAPDDGAARTELAIVLEAVGRREAALEELERLGALPGEGCGRLEALLDRIRATSALARRAEAVAGRLTLSCPG